MNITAGQTVVAVSGTPKLAERTVVQGTEKREIASAEVSLDVVGFKRTLERLERNREMKERQ
jgi:hypothetical protein